MTTDQTPVQVMDCRVHLLFWTDEVKISQFSHSRNLNAVCIFKL